MWVPTTVSSRSDRTDKINKVILVTIQTKDILKLAHLPKSCLSWRVTHSIFQAHLYESLWGLTTVLQTFSPLGDNRLRSRRTASGAAFVDDETIDRLVDNNRCLWLSFVAWQKGKALQSVWGNTAARNRSSLFSWDWRANWLLINCHHSSFLNVILGYLGVATLLALSLTLWKTEIHINTGKTMWSVNEHLCTCLLHRRRWCLRKFPRYHHHFNSHVTRVCLR